MLRRVWGSSGCTDGRMGCSMCPFTCPPKHSSKTRQKVPLTAMERQAPAATQPPVRDAPCGFTDTRPCPVKKLHGRLIARTTHSPDVRSPSMPMALMAAWGK